VHIGDILPQDCIQNVSVDFSWNLAFWPLNKIATFVCIDFVPRFCITHLPSRCSMVTSVTWLVTLAGLGGEGGKTDNGYYELYFTNESYLKEAKIDPVKRKFFIFFFLCIFYLPLFNSVIKYIIPRLKNIEGGICPLPPAPLPSYAYEHGNTITRIAHSVNVTTCCSTLHTNLTTCCSTLHTNLSAELFLTVQCGISPVIGCGSVVMIPVMNESKDR
jgi:hypothetical protein